MRHGGIIHTANIDHLAQLRHDPNLLDVFDGADILVADGAPVLWLAQLQGNPIPERIAGSDLIWDLSTVAADSGIAIVLIGGKEGSAKRAADVLAESIPGLKIAASHCPPFGFERSRAQMERIHELVDQDPPVLVFCGLGFPKESRLIQELAKESSENWYLGCGAAIDMTAGRFARAPRWVQKLGLEWLYRLSLEPRRLFGRYVLRDLPFFLRQLTYSIRFRMTERSGRGFVDR